MMTVVVATLGFIAQSAILFRRGFLEPFFLGVGKIWQCHKTTSFFWFHRARMFGSGYSHVTVPSLRRPSVIQTQTWIFCATDWRRRIHPRNYCTPHKETPNIWKHRALKLVLLLEKHTCWESQALLLPPFADILALVNTTLFLCGAADPAGGGRSVAHLFQLGLGRKRYNNDGIYQGIIKKTTWWQLGQDGTTACLFVVASNLNSLIGLFCRLMAMDRWRSSGLFHVAQCWKMSCRMGYTD